jgi:hypothetical protein
MSGQFDFPVAPAPQPKAGTAVKVIVLVLRILGILGMCCGAATAAFYAAIPASAVSPGVDIDQMHLGGSIIAGLICLPGIFLIVVAFFLWLFLWRGK